MELIKQIKQAEAQAQQIIEQAKAKAAEQAGQHGKKQRQIRLEAEQQRKKAVDAAVDGAWAQGKSEVAVLKAEAEKQKNQLRQETKPKVSAAIARVMDHLKG